MKSPRNSTTAKQRGQLRNGKGHDTSQSMKFEMPKKHMKKMLRLLAIREMQTKITIRFHLTPVRLPVIQK